MQNLAKKFVPHFFSAKAQTLKFWSSQKKSVRFCRTSSKHSMHICTLRHSRNLWIYQFLKYVVDQFSKYSISFQSIRSVFKVFDQFSKYSISFQRCQSVSKIGSWSIFNTVDQFSMYSISFQYIRSVFNVFNQFFSKFFVNLFDHIYYFYRPPLTF
jgi:hypothetical protein